MPVKWEPLMNDMLSFKRSIDRQFENFFSSNPFLKNLAVATGRNFPAWKPEVDVYETKRDVVVEADIPGCDKKDVKIEVDNNMLTIKGEKREEKETRKKNFYQKEQRMGSFYRSVTLPSYANASKPKATYEKGVLKIAFPKSGTAHIAHKMIEIAGK
jgi:HSP20 family protein